MIGATPALPEWDRVSYAAGEETGGNCSVCWSASPLAAALGQGS